MIKLSCAMENENIINRNWSKEATTLLIKQYQIYECMWMTTSPTYRNKQKRNEALINIAIAVSKLRPRTTAEDIKNKINGIRTQYVSEINKVIIAGNRGEHFKPTLWCYEILNFLKPFTQPKQKAVNNWSQVHMSSTGRPYLLPTPTAKPQDPNPYQPEPSNSNKNCIIIKEEGDSDVTIIEEDTDTIICSPETNQQQPSTSTKEATDSGYEDQEQTKRVKKLLSPSGISAEITLVPKTKTAKRKSEEIEYVEDKKTKSEIENSDKDEELDNRISIFGKFVMSQMKIIKDKVLFLKLEHTIQNAIIEAQLKQMEMDELKKEKENK